MQALARELAVVLIVPMFERQAAGIYRNSAAVIDADGTLLGVYRKMHIPDDPLFNEKYYFTPGDGHIDYHGEQPGEANGFKVWKTRYATIGVLICWDQWYPEAARITALLGAQVLFYPTAIGWHPAEKDEWGQAQVEAWRTIQRATRSPTASTWPRPTASATRTSRAPNGITFFGHSFIADPFGRYVAEAGEDEAILIATCDPALIETVRRNWPFLRDRRVDAYGPILNRYLGVTDRAGITSAMPAEWEPHRATWISWPHHEPDWPGKLGPIPWVYAEIARVIAEHEPVEILCQSDEPCTRPRTTRSTRTACAPIASGCTWCRPTASGCATRRRPASLDAAGDVVLVNWAFNAWAKYDNWQRDDLASGAAIAAHHRPAARRADARRQPAGASCSRAAASTSTATA